MIFEKEALWSILKIITNNEIDNNILNKIINFVDIFENKYSRFIKNNFLYNLNKYWESIIDKDFLTLFNLSKTLYKLTDWYFDITIWNILTEYWYWKQYNTNNIIWFENIILNWNQINLNWTNIDFWALWKWYIIDNIYDFLINNYDDFIIDFGWDIKVWNIEKNIWLEDPIDEKKLIWLIKVQNLSFASSSWNKRKFWNNHHLINPKNKLSQNDKISIYLTHKSACIADWFSTALFVTPLEKSLKILKKIDWLEWLIISKNWEIYKSKWFNVELY